MDKLKTLVSNYMNFIDDIADLIILSKKVDEMKRLDDRLNEIKYILQDDNERLKQGNMKTQQINNKSNISIKRTQTKVRFSEHHHSRIIPSDINTSLYVNQNSLQEDIKDDCKYNLKSSTYKMRLKKKITQINNL